VSPPLLLLRHLQQQRTLMCRNNAPMRYCSQVNKLEITADKTLTQQMWHSKNNVSVLLFLPGQQAGDHG
ncbi:hypothetical protein RSW31_26685, partial [Escherichia coli]|uniref:hypothetical protein n=1 Tax=Escherichia coli TaxID=562 RepID=UPI0028DE4643